MALADGVDAPGFSLPDERGSSVTRDDVVGDLGALLVFFKTTCPTCRLALPVYGRLHDEYGDAVPVVAIAQDPAVVARAWLDERGFRGRVLDDAAGGYAVSEAYDVAVVPTFVFVDAARRIGHTTRAWERDAANDWARRLATLAARPAIVVSTPDDGLPVLKPG